MEQLDLSPYAKMSFGGETGMGEQDRIYISVLHKF